MKAFRYGLLSVMIGLTTFLVSVQAEEPGENGQQLTMEQAVELSSERSLDIQIADKDLESAEVQYDQAVDRFKDKEISELVNAPTMTPSVVADAKITKETTLLQTENGVELAKQSLDFTKLQEKNEVESAYLDRLKAEKALSLAEQNVNRAARSYELTQLQYNEGLIAKSTLLNSQVQVEQAKSSLINAETQAKLAAQNLNVILNYPLEQVFEIQEVEVDDVTLEYDLTTLQELALQNRPDYLAEINKVDTEKKKYDIYLGIYLSSSNSNVKSMKIAYEKAELALKQKENNVRLEVSSSYEGFLASRSQVDMLKASVEASKEAFDIAQLQYEEGLNTLFDVTSAQISLFEAEKQLLDAQYGILTAYSQLELAVATSLE